MSKNKAIQGLRGILIIMVFLTHCPLNKYKYVGALGGWAVEVFFVLSGFLSFLSKKSEFHKLDLKNSIGYAIDRIKDVYLLYIIMSTFAIPLIIGKYFILHEGGTIITILFRIVSNFLLINTIIPTYIPALIGTGWFVSTIFFLYIACPFLKKIFTNSKNLVHNVIYIIILVCLRLFVMALITYVLGNSSSIYIYESPIIRIFDFAIGMVVANMCTNCGRLKEFGYYINALTGISVCFIFLLMDLVDGYVMCILIIVNSICSIISSFINNGLISNILSSKGLVFLGDRSKYIFLIHIVIIEYIVGLEMICGQFNIYFVITLEIVLTLICVEMWILLENKILHRKSVF